MKNFTRIVPKRKSDDFFFATFSSRTDKACLVPTLFLRGFQEDVAKQIPEHLDCLDFDSLVR